MDVSAVNSWGWFALALVNAGLAEQKNRSRLVWFLVSLLLGPIATLLIVVWEPAPVLDVPPPRIDKSTSVLAAGVIFTVFAAVAGASAFNARTMFDSSGVVLWVVTSVLIAAALVCFVYFVVRRPKDVAAAAARRPEPARQPETGQQSETR